MTDSIISSVESGWVFDGRKEKRRRHGCRQHFPGGGWENGFRAEEKSKNKKRTGEREKP
jgi:hypothetical protein